MQNAKRQTTLKTKKNLWQRLLFGLVIIILAAVLLNVPVNSLSQDKAKECPVVSMPDGKYDGAANGYKGPLRLRVTVKNGSITGLELIAVKDDYKYYHKALEQISADMIKRKTCNVDTVSGATYSSRGIINAVKNALAAQ